MAVITSESKTAKSSSVTSKKGTTATTPAYSASAEMDHNEGTASPSLHNSIEAYIAEAFKKEFRGMPYTDINVVVRCGAPSSPTYQEIELPEVSSFLKKFRG